MMVLDLQPEKISCSRPDISGSRTPLVVSNVIISFINKY